MSVRVAIGAMACTSLPKYVAQLQACLETWVPDCERSGIPVRFFDGEFFSMVTQIQKAGVDDPRIVRLPGVGNDYNSASDKQWLGFQRLHVEFDPDFALIVGTDNYVWVDNLLRLLQDLSPEAPWAIGGFQQARCYLGRYWVFPLGGGGLLLSRGALKIMAEQFPSFADRWRHTMAPRELAAACDVAFAALTEEHRIPQLRLYDLHACSWLYKYQNPDYVNVGPINYERLAICHYMEPWDLRAYHRLRDVAAAYRWAYEFSQETRLQPFYQTGRRFGRVILAGLVQPEAALALARGLIDAAVEASYSANTPKTSPPCSPSSSSLLGTGEVEQELTAEGKASGHGANLILVANDLPLNILERLNSLAPWLSVESAAKVPPSFDYALMCREKSLSDSRQECFRIYSPGSWGIERKP